MIGGPNSQLCYKCCEKLRVGVAGSLQTRAPVIMFTWDLMAASRSHCAPRNIFQLFTAFERVIDELHASHRIELPAELDPRHPYYPLSFFHTYGPNHDPLKGTKSSLLFDRLVNIEKASSYEALGALFDLRWPDLAPEGYDGYICGH